MKIVYRHKLLTRLNLPDVGVLQDGHTYDLPDDVAKKLLADYPTCTKASGSEPVTKTTPGPQFPTPEDRELLAQKRTGPKGEPKAKKGGDDE